MKNTYNEEILALLKKAGESSDIALKLSDYHESDIADAMTELSTEERKHVYASLPAEYLSEIIAYMEDAHEYLSELSVQQAASLIANMDADDAVDVLEEMDEEEQMQLVALMEPEASEDIQMILSYEDDEIGSHMTTNYIGIPDTLSIKEAMHAMVEQAGENDNISIIYVIDSEGKFFGTIRLKDLIRAREHDTLSSVIYEASPYVLAHEKIADCIERIRSYEEDSMAVLDEQEHLLGIITAQDVIEVVDEELGEDYAKLAGLTSQEDLEETVLTSMKKRLPWLIVLLVLGIGVSGVVGIFEGVVASLPIIMCFQSLILDMAGNVGTQSLAVTIRVLMDENVSAKEKMKLVFKEMKVGLSNGMFLGVLSFVSIGLYIAWVKNTAFAQAFVISACVGIALMTAMLISSVVGTIVPMFFHRIHVDPAVASGPLITTVNDLVAVVTYYGLSYLLLIQMLHLA